MYSCVLIDIVPVSSEQPVGADQEQVFEEEEPQCLSKEGKWTSPSTYSSFLDNCMLINIYIQMLYCINLIRKSPF
jgi:hypothetical protein